MTRATSVGARRTFLVEHYRPSASAADLERLAAQVRSSIAALERNGHQVAFRHSTVVATDETLLCVVDAASEDLIRLAYDQAGVTFERISEARTEQS